MDEEPKVPPVFYTAEETGVSDEHVKRTVEANKAYGLLWEERSRYCPPSLIKATEDSWEYALKLRTGEIVLFESAEIHGDYATLQLLRYRDDRDVWIPVWNRVAYGFSRGLDVQIADIVWCVDAPWGS